MTDKKFAIINSNNTEIISTIKDFFSDRCDVVDTFDNIDKYDLIVLSGGISEISLPEKIDVINIHKSLLPSFKSENPIKEAFLAGVKVSGVTIHRVEKDNFFGQIIAQYPVLIGLDTHIDEFENEIIDIEKKLIVPVIDAILNDKVFDFRDLFKSGCRNGGCGGNCSGCKH